MIIITAGCSFSLTDQDYVKTFPEEKEKHIKTWPNYLSEELGATLISKAMGSQGNGLISRGIIYEVSQNLDEDIKVGVMWSGTDRHEVWSKEPLFENVSGWVENPTGFIPESKHWQILNPHWMTEKSDVYYTHLHEQMFGWISSLEHILRTQWFLDKCGIPYFMSWMKDPVFPDENNLMPGYKELKHLKDLVNWDKFLPIIGMYEWCDGCEGKADHPSTEQHEQFTREVILPFGFK
ncbi:MAG: hypothetical protein CL515_03975 [Actinobacteria bacterium]|nr:hypothetical protein [Actinomycetota bacterium]|tara:strand:+ start:62020 stop:62727 length:708 start_codon:yes stop_codon:yes gene_type:complete